ncbi:esterase family protein [Sediminibacillus dalangtanensis]|uniref:Esterase family protein n=1 Tax=Sediminibacillus dalangtanensis TaxID=2729421 RepID=A0ABX7VSY1_9BACI|nr:alpha/beta hydrolase-fold protein [Sediminibacillus dalangtanensis]QTM98715.1 esterase family protein [Sediminibacillus dalangtanensis]
MGRKGKMLDRQIDSKYLDEIMTIKWYLPESFSPLYKYHVCIMQDGDDYFQLGRIATLSDRLHSDGEIENTVFVGIHYNDKYDRQDKYHPNGSKQAAYMQFLLHEVVPLLDEELPTYHVGGSRALIGDSLAGTLALMTALKYSNTFGKVIMQSPYVDEKVLNAVQSAKSVDTLDIYHTIGNEETDVPTTAGDRKDFLEPNRKLRELIEQQDTNYVYHELDGNHTWKFWQKDLKRALVTMFNG